jgi:hypothetical protein
MTISMYQASAPRFANTLKNLAAILDKAEAHATAKKIDPAVLLASRLYPGMFALVRRVQIASDNAKGAMARLAGIEVPKYEDNEQTFADLKARIAKTIDHALPNFYFHAVTAYDILRHNGVEIGKRDFIGNP